MADIRLAKPAAGTTQTVPSAPDGRFIFDFPADAATLTRSGDNLVLTFEDGASIQLQDFYTTYSKEEMPSFQVEGVEISGQDFFAALGEDLMPAAGPAAGSSASRSGRYNEYGGSDLLDGLDHLGRLDIGFDGGVQLATDTVEPSPYYEDDHGVTVTPSAPGTDSDDPDIPVQGEDFPPTMPHDVLQVDESALDGGSGGGSATADGSMSVSAPDGVATITIGGVVVWQNGALTGNPVQTDEGHLDVTGFDGTNLTYTYTLDKATQEHAEDGADKAIAHEMEVVVTDSDGDSGSAVIRVEITDDVPTIESFGHDVTEGSSTVINGDALEGSAAGADGADFAWTNPAQQGQYGTITLNEDGTYTYTLDNDNAAVKELSKDETLTEEFTYTYTDADGDVATGKVTITINGVDNGIVVTPSDPEAGSDKLTVYESGLDDGSQAGQAGAPTTAEGSLSITAPDGVASIVIDGKEVVVNGALTGYAENRNIPTDEGVLTVTGFDAATGKLTFTYRLTGNTTEHGDKAEWDTQVSHDFTVTVTDVDNSTATSTITVTIVDDVPVLESVNITSEDLSDTVTTISGQVEGLEFGADVDGSTVKVDVNGTAYTGRVSVDDAGKATITFADGAPISMNADGSFTYTRPTADVQDHEADDYTFTVTVTDADGDTVTAGSVTVTTTEVEPGVSTPTDLVVDEDGLVHDNNSETATGQLVVELHGQSGTVTIGSVAVEVAADGTVSLPENAVAEGIYGNLAITGASTTDGKTTIEYSYTLDTPYTDTVDDANTTNTVENGDAFVITINGDNAGSISVDIIDDVPTISSVDADNDGKPDITFERYPDVDSEDTPLGDGTTADFTKYDESTPLNSVSNSIWNGEVTISGGRVKYTYSNEEERIVDTIEIISEEKGISYSSHVTNGNIGNSVEERKDSMGLTVAGEAEISADSSYDDEGICTGVANQSDAIIVTLPEGTVAYGLNLKLGAFFTESSSTEGTKWDTVAEQALLTFYKDGEVVLIYPVTANSADGSYTVPADLVITEGFDKVVISAVDNSWASKDNYRLEQSDFVVQEIGFVTLPPNEVMFRYEGDLVSDGGADGFADGYRFAFSDKMGESMQVKLDDGNTVTAKLTITEGDNGSSILLATVPGADDGKPENLFSVTLDADGHWKFDQYQEFSMPGGSDFELGFMTKDNDGDKAYEEVTLITTTETNLGTSGDHAPTSSADVIVDGNSGHDNFVGDPGGATAGSETTTYPNLNVALVVDKSGSMDDNAGDGSSRMEHMQNALKSLGTQLAEYLETAPEGTSVDVALIAFSSSATTLTFTSDDLKTDTIVSYKIGDTYVSQNTGEVPNWSSPQYRVDDDGNLETRREWWSDWEDTHEYEDSRDVVTVFEDAVNSLTAEGGTSYASGFTKAEQWLSQEDIQSAGDKNVVLLVTDGLPGNYQNNASSIETGYENAKDAYDRLTTNGNIPHLTVESIGIQLSENENLPGWPDSYKQPFPQTAKELLDSLTTDGEATNVTDISQLAGTFTGFIDKVISEGTVTPAADDIILGGRGNDMLFGDALNADYLLGDEYTWEGKDTYVKGSSWSIIQAYLAATLGYQPTETDIAKFISQNADKLGLTDSITGDTSAVRGGNDTLLGGSGDDIVYGQGGDDLIFGDGSDTATDAMSIETLNTLDRLLTEAGAGTGDSYAERIQGLVTQGSQEEPSALDSFIDSLEGTGGIEKDTDGDDFIDGGEGRDTIFGGSGNDIIVYDSNDYLVSGGSGIDFMVSNDSALTMDKLLSGTGAGDGPIVDSIEVLLKGDAALSLTSIQELADKYGITLGTNPDGQETLTLDMSKWTYHKEIGVYTSNEGNLTLETNLTPVEASDPASEAVQQQVFTLEHGNG